MDKFEKKTVDKVLFTVFILLSITFLAIAIWLAVVNQCPGGPDSRNNLDVARNIAHGKGFVSNIVQQLYVIQELPGLEEIRGPGIPFLYAPFYKVFGQNHYVHVIMNALIILLNAWLMRRLVMMIGARWFAEVAGILMLLSGNFDLISLVNNNYLTLLTIILLTIAVKTYRDDYDPIKIAFWMALITGIGFMLKQTFVLSAFPLSIFILLMYRHDNETHLKQRNSAIVLYAIASGLLISPYFIMNYLNSGNLLSAPLSALRLAERYGGLPYGTWYTMRLGEPVTYSEMIQTHGFWGLVIKELQILKKGLWELLKLNIPLVFIVVTGLLIMRSRISWKQYAPAFFMMIEPVFTAIMYWHVEMRYLWPIYSCLIYITAHLIRDFKIWEQSVSRTDQLRRFRNGFAILLIIAFVFGFIRVQLPIRGGFFFATKPLPTWIESVSSIPETAVVITDDPWSSAWLAERRSVMCPAGERWELQKVIDAYRPDYYLHTGRGYGGGEPAFEESDLELIDKGESYCEHNFDAPVEWRFYKIRRDSELRN